MKKLIYIFLIIVMISVLVAGCKKTTDSNSENIIQGIDNTSDNTTNNDKADTTQTDTANTDGTDTTQTDAANNDVTDTTSTDTANTDDTAQSDTSVSDTGSSEQGNNDETSKLFPLDFELSDGRGNQVNLNDYKGNGKVLFVNFFTTWCHFCMDEMPEFQKAVDTYKDNLQVLIVDVNFDSAEKSVADVVKWYDNEGYTIPMVIDEDGSKTSEFYPYVQGYPTTFVYGPDGSFLGYLSGAMDETMISQIMDQYATK